MFENITKGLLQDLNETNKIGVGGPKEKRIDDFLSCT